ncbi:SDR family NAD(P)-dependent oxidoreductase [Halocatena marina]|uniref:SDR family NAD(P)-dependent oxidoreductase n=1 Tax=Halocatena marina TaxID=2934937 RepID=UPI0022258451|nr:SDR family oxidoreductase [Halocatena marina]
MPHADLTVPGESAAITGAGTGIGRQITDHLTRAGVNVAVNDVDADALDSVRTMNNDGNVVTLQGDASDPSVTSALVDRAIREFGGLDILVNNVGRAGPTKPCEEISHEAFMQTLEVNLGAMHSASKAAIPHLGGGGRIINLSSMSGKRPLRDRTPYVTSKMGVLGFTRTLAVELAERDVTVNAVCPGSVSGPRLENVMKGQAESQSRPYEEVERAFREVSPMDEFVTAQDVADAVLFLCSERADRMTGQDLNVTAGIVMY